MARTIRCTIVLLDQTNSRDYAWYMRRISLDRSWRYVLAAWLGTMLLLSFVGFFTAMAVYNIVHLQAVVRSAVWTVLVTFFVTALVIDNGLKQSVIALLGFYARRWFVETVPAGENAAMPAQTSARLVSGFELLSRTLHYRDIPLDSIISVDWSPGQVSDRSGRDANDWHVWVYHNVKGRSREQASSPCMAHDLFAIGDEGSREQAEELGRRVVALLQEAGVRLVETQEGRRTKFQSAAGCAQESNEAEYTQGSADR